MSEPSYVELESLLGLHRLTGVDYDSDSALTILDPSDYRQAQVINICLDGITYTAAEDPIDGYRSMLKGLFKTDHKITNLFPAVPVLCAWRNDVSEYRDVEILDMWDAKNGRVILSVGTDSSDSYYPSFVFNFTPENMSINAGVEKGTGYGSHISEE